MIGSAIKWHGWWDDDDWGFGWGWGGCGCHRRRHHGGCHRWW
ncbi:hypothetical protein SAMN05421505_1157 [Sinosporangium album]|uniref:Uncharacterized protein n=1 Tax=Sinosporangium album TaxID=504805 RepID=A0A1G8BZU0_9ACTN|nr:hypothetical protein SAMN05421505_1157 [Sinosporangium album]